ncbi:hypothetical protein [Anaerotignum sp.]
MYYADNGIFLSDKQLKLLNALYKSDLMLKEFEQKADLIYEDWLEVLHLEDYLQRFIEVTEQNDPMQTIFHLNSEGRAIIEAIKSRRRENLINRLLSIFAILISIATWIKQL